LRSADESANGNGTPSALGAGAAPPLASRGADDLVGDFFTAGDEAAFGEIVRRYAGMVFATCLRVTRDAHDAEDATQATFLTLAVQCKTDKPVRKLTPWLQQVAKRAALDLKRSRTRRQVHEHRRSELAARSGGQFFGQVGDVAGTAGSASAPVRHGDDFDVEKVNRVLAEEVARLPAKYRLPLISLYFGGMSRQEVAKEMGCTPAALSVRVHRGRQMLAKRLSARGVVTGPLALAGGMLAAGVGAALREALVARTAEAVAGAALGKDLAVCVSSGVVSILRAASVASGAGGVVAKLKLPVLLVLLVVAATASASGAAGKVREAVSQWCGELTSPGVRRVIQMLRSPFRAPRASAVKRQPAGGIPAPSRTVWGFGGGTDSAPMAQEDPSSRFAELPALVQPGPAPALGLALRSPVAAGATALAAPNPGDPVLGERAIDTRLTPRDSRVDFTVLCESGPAFQLGLHEDVLGIWRIGDGEWPRINDTSISGDFKHRILSAHASAAMTFVPVSVPEPGAATMALLAGGLLLLRRRRQR